MRAKQLKGVEDMARVRQMTLKVDGKLTILKEDPSSSIARPSRMT